MSIVSSFAPILVLSVGGLGYLVGGKSVERRGVAGFLAIVLIGLALWFSTGLSDSSALVRHGLVINSFSRLLAVTACAGALVSVIATLSSLEGEKIAMYGEYYYLMVTSLCGALVMIFASDFLTLFIGVEIASLALYCLCGARVASPRSSEASMKYFLLGCFSSACLLYGIALWYGMTGSLIIQSIPAQDSQSPMVALSFLLMLVGIAFKIGLAPFHFWVPDVYQGAPTSVTTFMSCVVKVAAVGALLKITSTSFGYDAVWSSGSLWFLSVVAMTAGNVAALQQRSIKRMLAYSSVAHAGYMMMGVATAGAGQGSIAATVYYLIIYCAMTIGSFSVLSVMGPDVDDIDELRGLSKRSPFLAGALTLFFLGLAGLPPSLAGLMGKVYLFSSALSASYTGLAIIAALNSALACAYYIRVPMAILSAGLGDKGSIRVELSARVAIALCVAAVVLFGVFPEPLLMVARLAAQSLVGR